MRRRTVLVLGLVASALASPQVAVAGSTYRGLREAVGFYRKGVVLQRRGDIARAETNLIKATNALPGFPEAHVSLGNIAFRAQRYEEALTHYQDAWAGYERLGDVLFDVQADRYNDAREMISDLRDAIQAIESGKVKWPVPDLKVFELQQTIQHLELIRLPDRSELSHPPGELSFLIGNVQFHLGHIEEAVAAWEVCAQRAPDFPLVYNNLAVGYLKLGKGQRAIECVQRAESLGVTIHPGLKRDIETSLKAGI